jgi:hypothetical protein
MHERIGNLLALLDLDLQCMKTAAVLVLGRVQSMV